MRITKANLRRWLEQKRPTEIVGIRSDPCDCPVSWYLHSGGRYTAIFVDPDTIMYQVNTSHPLLQPLGTYQNPFWLQRFIERIDRSGTKQTGVRARTALRLLEQV